MRTPLERMYAVFDEAGCVSVFTEDDLARLLPSAFLATEIEAYERVREALDYTNLSIESTLDRLIEDAKIADQPARSKPTTVLLSSANREHSRRYEQLAALFDGWSSRTESEKEIQP